MEPLWKIDERLQRIIDIDGDNIDPETGELVDIDSLNLEREEKIGNIVKAIKNLKSEEEALNNASKELGDRAAAKEKKIAFLKSYLSSHMKEGEKYECVAGKIRWYKKPAVVIDCEFEKLPKEYLRVRYTPDKIMLQKDLKSGKEIPGARLEDRTSISIR